MGDPCMGSAPRVTARQLSEDDKKPIRAARARGVEAVVDAILPLRRGHGCPAKW